MKTRRIALLVSSGLVAIAGAAPVWAQEAQQPQTGSQAATASDVVQAANAPGEDIIVTAQKRAQTLVDVPQSITVVSGATLEHQQAPDIQDFLKLVPGVQLTQDTPGFGRLVFRGINTGGVASTVGVYVDETPFGSSSALVNGAILAGDFDTFDIARVEVLRGPQGTLYGASSLAGVFKYVTNAPETDRFIGRARGGVETVKGGDLSYYGNAVINIPLGDTLAFRASGTYRRDGGFIDSTGLSSTDVFGNTFTTRNRRNINTDRTYGGRASLLFKPSDAFSVRLSAILQNIDADAPTTVDADPNTLHELYGRPTQSLFTAPKSSVSYRVYNGLINANLGFATLTSSSSYATLRQRYDTDVTFNLGGLINFVFGLPGAPPEVFLPQTTRVEKYTEEVRLASNPSSIFDWLLGGYYTHEKGVIDQAYSAVVPGTSTPAPGLPLLAQVNASSTYQEIAGFADGTLHLGEHFDIDLGGRYSHNKQRANQMQDGALAGGPATYPTATSSENVFTYSVAPKLKLNNRASIYLRVAKGFRPGGPNALPPGTATTGPLAVPTTFKSDSLVSYEAGFKGETQDRTFAIELSAFHIDWNRIQLFAVVNNFGINVNGTGAKSDGVEFNTTFRPTAGFDLSINGAYTRARLSGDTSPLVGGRKGDQLPFTPKFSAGVNGDYRWAIGGTEAFVGASLRALSKQSGAFDADYRAANGRQRQVFAYDVVDLRAGVDVGRFGIELYAKNLTNAAGVTSTGALTANGVPILPNGAVGTGILRPRTVGLSLTASY